MVVFSTLIGLSSRNAPAASRHLKAQSHNLGASVSPWLKHSVCSRISVSL